MNPIHRLWLILAELLIAPAALILAVITLGSGAWVASGLGAATFHAEQLMLVAYGMVGWGAATVVAMACARGRLAAACAFGCAWCWVYLAQAAIFFPGGLLDGRHPPGLMVYILMAVSLFWCFRRLLRDPPLA